MKCLMTRFLRDEAGATAVEYGLLAALLALAMVGAMTALSDKLITVFEAVTAAVPVD